MLQMTLYLTRLSRLWTLLLLGLEVFLLRSDKNATNRFYGNTQRRDFRPLKHKRWLSKTFLGKDLMKVLKCCGFNFEIITLIFNCCFVQKKTVGNFFEKIFT
jgi:hypothetical protein